MKKILIIEDDLQTLYLITECLINKGFDAIDAVNGLSGVKQAKKYLPDVILCDISMPELDGYGVLKTLRYDPDTSIIPFIFLTQKDSKAEFRKVMEMGADDYLTKPCTFNELLGAISAQLDKQTTRKQWCITQPPQTVSTMLAETDKLSTTHSIFPSCTKLTEVFQFIELNYHRQITVSEVAEAVGYSPNYLTHLTGQETGNTVYGWIIERRMAEACSLLVETGLSVNQIAEAVGYQDAGYFSRQFHQFYSITPKAYRKEATLGSGEALALMKK